MAAIPSSLYPAQTIINADYPLGAAQDVATTGDGTGFPFEKDWVNDLLGFEQALLAAASITPSGTPDNATTSQYLLALQALFAPKANRIIADTRLNHSGGISGSTTSTSPVLIANTFFASPVVAGDKIEIDFGPLSVSTSASSDADLVVHLVEDYDASATPVVNEDYLLPSLGTDPKIISWKFTYIVTKTGNLSFQLNQTSMAGITFQVASLSNLGNWGYVRTVRP